MYRRFYGLERKPFELTPDGRHLYLSEAHREGIAVLRYGVFADKGFLMLTGAVGTGKTTMINTLLTMLKDKVRVCVVNDPKLTRDEFYHFLAKRLNLRCIFSNKGDFILKFSARLESLRQKNEKLLIIIDEAQVFPVELIEEVRLLSNHAGPHNVLSIFLVGQPELRDLLADPRLLPLRQRIGIHYHVPELTATDTANYIAFRLGHAGAANTALFSSAAIDCVHRATGGNPRLINIVCDHALISGFSKELKQIDRDTVQECMADLRLPGEIWLTDTGSDQGTLQQGDKGPASSGLPSRRWLTVLFIVGLSTLGAAFAVWLFLSLQ
jgi:general secretion pathway protein A